jgi:hypothetical protein
MKKRIEKIKAGSLILSLVLIGVLIGCQSGNTSGGDVADDGEFGSGKSGSLSLTLTSGTQLRTGAMQGFRVAARDASGSPIQNIRITCDTEDGLALIEPNTGIEQTDGNGEMSGKVGCNNKGSYLMMCRLPSPSSARASETIVCTGERPSGFNGWPSAGGGGLGGGSSDIDTISRVRVTDVDVADSGSFDSATSSIDIVQGVCDSGGTPTIEPFFDTSVRFSITNNSNSIVRFTGMRYTVSDAYGTGTTATSGKLSVTGSAATAVDSNGGTGQVDSLLFDAQSGAKAIFGGNTLTAGFKNVTFTLYGENEIGDTFEVKTAVALSFDGFNRCS